MKFSVIIETSFIYVVFLNEVLEKAIGYCDLDFVV